MTVATACNVSGDESGPRKPEPADGTGPTTLSTSTAPTASDERVFPGGQALSDYEGQPSYPWRVSILDNEAELLGALQEVDPSLDEESFADVVTTCADINAGDSDTEVQQAAAERFGVEESQAADLVTAATTYACP
ncbi:MAG: hypothetical protein JWN84_1777 [Nocardioides sp.]|nr:hypothetical protein [Nocardioides sp.]